MRPSRRLATDVAGELRYLIDAEFPTGSKLPGEKELADQFDVSRNTLREALLQLWNEGLVTRRWGVGTFVQAAQAPLAQSLTDVVPMRDMIKAAGHEGSLAECQISTAAGLADAAAALGLQHGAQMWRVRRTFAVDGHPAAVFDDWLPLSINGRRVDLQPLASFDVDLLTLLRDAARCRIARMESELSAVGASEEVARSLDVPPGSHLLLSTQISITDAGAPVIFSLNHYATDVIGLRLVRTPTF